jgi:hypothetical protein
MTTQEITMNKLTLSLCTLAAALAASVTLADAAGPGYGQGYGPGNGPNCVAGGTPGAGCGYGPGAGHGPGAGMGGGGGGRGYGAQLLTPEERIAHMTAMHSFTTLAECNAYMVEHQKLIAERATEKGLPAPPQRGNMCERMAARGFFS